MRAGMYHDCIFNYIIQLLYGLFQFVQPVVAQLWLLHQT